MSFKRNLAVIAASAMLTGCGGNPEIPSPKGGGSNSSNNPEAADKRVIMSLEYSLSPESEEIMKRALEFQKIIMYIDADTDGDGDIDKNEATEYNKKVAETFRGYIEKEKSSESSSNPNYSIGR